MRVIAPVFLAAVLLTAGAFATGQQVVPAQPGDGTAAELTVVSQAGRQTLPVATVNTHEMVSLADLSRMFQLTVREDTVAGGITVSRAGRTLVLSPTQGLASAGGRLVSLPAPPVRHGDTWLVPIDFIARALSLIHETPIARRPGSRLVVVGDVRVPRVVARAAPGGAGQVRVTLDVTPRTPYKIEQEQNRLVVRFEAEALDADVGVPETGEVLTSLRVVDPLTAVGMDLGPRFGSFRSAEEAAGANAARIAIDLLPEGAPPGAPVTPPTEAAAEPPPLIFDQPVSALRTIVIDPGHGGEETGARGPAGTLEKDVALAVARQLKATIEQRLGLRVLLTRDGDQTVPLDQRAAFANNNKADVFISLHANASVRSAVAGAEVFFLSLDDYGSEARRVADAEGRAVPALGGGSRQIEVILWEMAQVRHLEASGALATLVEQQLRQRVPVSARAIQQAPFRVLVGANMPAVLVEMGFISNPDEEALLNSSAHQQQIVTALYEAILRFRDYLERGRTAASAAGPVGGAAGGPR
jgi:N-acetylmuramoyl-L-alanine amidase